MASGVEFDTDKSLYRPPQSNINKSSSVGNDQQQGVGGISGWLIRKGLAKSENSAQIILIGVVILNVVITIIMIKFFL